ncbi:hypothetical protein ACH5RR_041176 [Cinchona calisaya]|uniref:Uncharacterized protein n=1 Tax=Cinchona calisaya TaxID=153742 RepID=A0ABD2XW15_9GENT
MPEQRIELRKLRSTSTLQSRMLLIVPSSVVKVVEEEEEKENNMEQVASLAPKREVNVSELFAAAEDRALHTFFDPDTFDLNNDFSSILPFKKNIFASPFLKKRFWLLKNKLADQKEERSVVEASLEKKLNVEREPTFLELQKKLSGDPSQLVKIESKQNAKVEKLNTMQRYKAEAEVLKAAHLNFLVDNVNNFIISDALKDDLAISTFTRVAWLTRRPWKRSRLGIQTIP